MSLAFENHLESIRSWFGKRVYPNKLLDNQLRRVLKNRLKQLFVQQMKQSMKLVLQLWLYTILSYLHAEEQVTQAFTPAPFVLFRSIFSLRNHLVGGKVCSLLKEKGSPFCG